MDATIVIYFVLLAVLLPLSFFFSGSETAMFSLGRVKIERFLEERRPKAQVLGALLAHPRKLLHTVLFGNELVNVAVSILVASIVSTLFVGRSWGVILTVSSLTSVTLLLLIGEVTPKTIAVKNAERWAFAVARFLYFWSALISPLRAVFTFIADRIVAVFGIAAPTAEGVILEEEFRTLVDVGRKEGVVDEREQELIDKVFEFGDRTVEQIMTPRPEVVSLSSSLGLDEVLKSIRASRFSRIPVYERGEDDIIGLLYAKDLLRFLHDSRKRASSAWQSLLRKPYFIPMKKKADRLFAEFRQMRTHFAIVVDEFGGVAGVVSLEDLLEEVFGEILDEYDRPEKPLFAKEAGGYRVRANMPVDEFNRRFKTEVPQEDGSTIGGFVLNLFGHLPAEAAVTRYGKILFEVARLEGNRISEIRIRFEEGT